MRAQLEAVKREELMVTKREVQAAVLAAEAKSQEALERIREVRRT